MFKLFSFHHSVLQCKTIFVILMLNELLLIVSHLGSRHLDGVDNRRTLDDHHLEVGVVDERLQNAGEDVKNLFPHLDRHRGQHVHVHVEIEGDHVAEELNELGWPLGHLGQLGMECWAV